MDNWQLDFVWLELQHKFKEELKRSELPDLDELLFIIGIQELGQIKDEFTKEEKQDLMHIAVCTLLSEDGFYTFVGRDQDGWPHFEISKNIATKGEKNQEKLLKQKIVKYFRQQNLDQEE